jgi:hypothetical protein
MHESICPGLKTAACRKSGLRRALTTYLCVPALVLIGLAAAAAPPRKPKPAPAPPPAPAPKAPAKAESRGAYVDSHKTTHAWRITATHALLWDGAPYVPVGGTFSPRSFESADASAWQADVAALARLEKQQVTDIILWPERPLDAVPAPAVQRLIDYLDGHGFRYGIEFGPGMTAPLEGTVVKPGSYRFADTKESLTATWQVSDADRAIFIITDVDRDNEVLKKFSTTVPVVAGAVNQPIDQSLADSKVVAILYPHKSVKHEGNGDLPDIWRSFDAYRDGLLTYLRSLKFGPGLRFFLDPLARHIGLNGEADFTVPDSPTFLLEWEGYLVRKYPNIEELKLAWGLNEGDFHTYDALARLIPLWANGRGVPYFFDPVANAPLRILDATQSHWWSDFLKYRDESLTYYLNAMALVLKRQVADVPVVVTWTQTHAMFSDPSTDEGYDGLAIAAHAHGTRLIARTAGPAYSAAEQSARTTWCVATEIEGDAAPRPTQTAQPQTASLPASPPAPAPYESRSALMADLEWLRRTGMKGFYAHPLQTPADRAEARPSWLAAPDSLAWLHEAETQFSTMQTASFAPIVLFYPQNAPGPARIGPVPGAANVLWMPSYRHGELLDWWPSYRGYTQPSANGEEETVLVSLRGKRLTHLWVKEPAQVRAYAPDGTEMPVHQLDKHTVSLELDDTPTVLRAAGQRFVPQEAASDVLFQLVAMLPQAVAQKAPNAEAEQFGLDRAKLAFSVHDYESCYSFARASLDNLTLSAQPYIWIEGEQALVHTFGEIAPNPEASNGAFLRLSTASPPSRLGYAARYLFNIPADGKYNVWLAASVPGPSTSPIQWRVNSEPPQPPGDSTPKGLYLNDRIGWIQLGTVELKKGDSQSLTIYVMDRAQSPPIYSFSIDCLLLTTHIFTPNGTVRPLPVDPDTIHVNNNNLRPRQGRGRQNLPDDLNP